MQLPNIDTLIATLDLVDYDTDASNLLKTLEIKKQESKNNVKEDSYENVLVTIGNMSFEIFPNGSRHHAYILHNDYYELKFARYRSRSVNNYPIFIKIKSACLWEKGYTQAWEDIKTLISNNIGEIATNKISRADLCCHTDELQIEASDIDRFSGKFRSDEIYRDDRKLSGFTFGSGKSKKIFCRIYNKTMEVVKKRQKLWFFNIWNENNMDKDNVWNVEFEIQRKFFKEYDIETVEDMFTKMSSLWKYCTFDWLQFKELDNNRKDRCSVTDSWINIQNSYNHIESKSLIKAEQRLDADADVLIPSIIGYITSFSARKKLGRKDDFDLGETIIDLTTRGLDYLERNKESNFVDEVQKKLALLAN
ncbi:hypothetical protein [Sporosalibacterium faouarense]|uniref:hypothetical protein n=1 Tax=Sporosalibacterium faouarense TaxID=516123 RepID=UPI00192B62D7|nr:hypothetical protein [Sporosalibacterium faouarense]